MTTTATTTERASANFRKRGMSARTPMSAHGDSDCRNHAEYRRTFGQMLESAYRSRGFPYPELPGDPYHFVFNAAMNRAAAATGAATRTALTQRSRRLAAISAAAAIGIAATGTMFGRISRPMAV